jgi:hypothetical protein
MHFLSAQPITNFYKSEPTGGLNIAASASQIQFMPLLTGFITNNYLSL